MNKVCRAFILEVDPDKEPFVVGVKRPLKLSDYYNLTPDDRVRKLSSFKEGKIIPFKFATTSWNELSWKIKHFNLTSAKLSVDCELPAIPNTILANVKANVLAAAKRCAVDTGQNEQYTINLFRSSNLGFVLRPSDITASPENKDEEDQKMPAVTPTVTSIVESQNRVSFEYATVPSFLCF